MLSPPKRLFVICRSYEQFRTVKWHANDTVIYVSGPDKIRGCLNIDFIFHESAWQRTDINDIIENLLICNFCGPYRSKTLALRLERLLYG